MKKLIITTALCLALVGCKDDKEFDPVTANQELIGLWKCVDIKGYAFVPHNVEFSSNFNLIWNFDGDEPFSSTYTLSENPKRIIETRIIRIEYDYRFRSDKLYLYPCVYSEDGVYASQNSIYYVYVRE